MKQQKYPEDKKKGEWAEQELKQFITKNIKGSTVVKVPHKYGWDLTVLLPQQTEAHVEVKWADDSNYPYNFALEVTNADDDMNFMFKHRDVIDYLIYLSDADNKFYAYKMTDIITFWNRWRHTRRINSHGTAHVILLPKEDAQFTFKNV